MISIPWHLFIGIHLSPHNVSTFPFKIHLPKSLLSRDALRPAHNTVVRICMYYRMGAFSALEYI